MAFAKQAMDYQFSSCNNYWTLKVLVIPYIGYTQIQLQILGIKDYDKDILVFIQKDSRYLEMFQRRNWLIWEKLGRWELWGVLYWLG